jgi:hypothetical protein
MAGGSCTGYEKTITYWLETIFLKEKINIETKKKLFDII